MVFWLGFGVEGDLGAFDPKRDAAAVGDAQGLADGFGNGGLAFGGDGGGFGELVHGCPQISPPCVRKIPYTVNVRFSGDGAGCVLNRLGK